MVCRVLCGCLGSRLSALLQPAAVSSWVDPTDALSALYWLLGEYRMRFNFRGTKLSQIADSHNIHRVYFVYAGNESTWLTT